MHETTILNFRHLPEHHALIEAMFAKAHAHLAERERHAAFVKSKVARPFCVLKRQFGYIKTRYRSLAKNRAVVQAVRPGNLFLLRRRRGKTRRKLRKVLIEPAETLCTDRN